MSLHGGPRFTRLVVGGIAQPALAQAPGAGATQVFHAARPAAQGSAHPRPHSDDWPVHGRTTDPVARPAETAQPPASGTIGVNGRWLQQMAHHPALPGAPERAAAKAPQHRRHVPLAFPPGRRGNLASRAGGYQPELFQSPLGEPFGLQGQEHLPMINDLLRLQAHLMLESRLPALPCPMLGRASA